MIYAPKSRITLFSSALMFALLAVLSMSGCATKMPTTESGFLSDYSKLVKVEDGRMRYESRRSTEYDAIIVDPVEVRISRQKLSTSDRAEAMRHFQEKLVESIQHAGWRTATRPGARVGRLRTAITEVAESTWWMKVHPVSRATGAGTGGAAMEGELIDSITGDQVGAVIQQGSGNQFDFTAFSTLADVKSAIDGWAQAFTKRLIEIRTSKHVG